MMISSYEPRFVARESQRQGIRGITLVGASRCLATLAVDDPPQLSGQACLVGLGTGGMIPLVKGVSDIEIDVDLSKALAEVLGRAPAEPNPVVVVSAYLHSLAKGYGLSNSQHLPESQLGRADAPAPALALVQHYLPDDAEDLRNQLYRVFVDLADDGRARKAMNRNAPLSELGLLKVAQVFWNLEASDERPRLPIRSGQSIVIAGVTSSADIKVEGRNKDFATMTWTERTQQGAEGLGAGQAHKSSGQGFRTKGARLAVLAAQRVVEAEPLGSPSLAGAILTSVPGGAGKPKTVISWPSLTSTGPAPAVAEPPAPGHSPHNPGPSQPLLRDTTSSAPVQRANEDRQPVLIGRPAEVGMTNYQRRGSDDAIDRLWADGGDRRVWLRGGPGLGKSYTARWIMEQAVASQSDDRERLLIWVDSAGPSAVITALSTAVDQLPHLGIGVPPETPDQPQLQALAMLGLLSRSSWRWLIVLDNADAGALIEAGLIPPGANPNGRVLVTTISQDHRISANGWVIPAELFTAPEAEAYLRAQRDPRTGGPSQLSLAAEADTAALAEAVGYHPLALAIAAATIIANTMEVTEWIDEFTTTELIDEAADAEDTGGYPLPIGATWKIALAKAALGLPPGVAERAAAVAAVLDPDGHPTWLWDRDEVAAWVGGGVPLARRHGRPVAVQRLIDNGIVELVGATWRDGHLAIHQLAARAVRELMSTQDLMEISATLLNELFDSDLPERQPDSLVRSVRQLIDLQLLAAIGRWAALIRTAEIQVNMGLDDAAVASYEEAYEVAEELAADAGFINETATARRLTARSLRGALWRAALEPQADIQERLGQADSARRTRLQVAEIYEGLVADADASPEETARHWRGLASTQDELDQPEAARQSRIQAERIYRDLAGVADSEAGTADRLWVLGELQQELGQSDEASTNYAKACAIYRSLVAEAGDEDDDDLPDLLRSLGSAQQKLGLLEEAEATLKRRVELLEHSPSGDDLASDWRELADLQSQLDRPDEAAKSYARVVELLHRAVNAGLRAWRSDLAAALQAQAQLSFSVPGLSGRAEDQFARASEITSELADESPGDHEIEQANSLWGLAMAQAHNGRHDEAVANLVRAIGTVTLLAELNPGHHEAALAEMLSSLGSLQITLHQREEALDSVARAIELYERLRATGADEHDSDLAEALDDAGHVLMELHRWEDAEVRFARARDVLVERDATHPGENDGWIAHVMTHLFVLHAEMGRLEQAASDLAQVVNLYGLLVETEPGEHEDDLYNSLRALEGLCKRLGRVDEANSARAQADQLAEKNPDLDLGHED